MIKIPPTFWTDVEQDLKYVLYGDSVADNSIISIIINNSYYNQTIEKIWDILLKYGYNIKKIKNHEYIYLNEKVIILTYDPVKAKIINKSPKYLMRHYLDGNLINLKFKDKDISITKNHSLIDIVDTVVVKMSPITTKYAYTISQCYEKIEKVNILSKKVIPYNGYVYDFEVPDTHNFIINGILVHNTDSLYINIPQQYDTIEESIKSTEEIADQINDLIKVYYNGFLLPKTGVDSKYNETFFKTELTAESIMFLETKKNYAYNMTSKEGKVFNPPKTKYVGIPVIKSDTVPFTKDLLIELVENVALNKEADRFNDITKLAKIFHEKLTKCVNEFDFEYISAPGKWSDKNYASEPSSITGMKLYNTIVDKDVFRSGSFGIYFPIEFKNENEFAKLIDTVRYTSQNYLNHTAVSKVKYITLPYNYDKEDLKLLFDKYGIIANINSLWAWSKLTENEVVKRIITVIKDNN